MKSRKHLMLAILAAAALLTAGVQAALALTPNDVQYNTTTTGTTTTGTTTTGTTTTDTVAALPGTTTTGTTDATPGAQNTLTPPTVGVKGTQSPVTPATAGGTLPFTGLDLGLVFAGGALLIAGGFALRRLGRKSSPPGP